MSPCLIFIFMFKNPHRFQWMMCSSCVFYKVESFSWPGWNSVTPGPTLSTMPAPSWPRTIGKPSFSTHSKRWYRSVWHTAVATIYNQGSNHTVKTEILVSSENWMFSYTCGYKLHRAAECSIVVTLWQFLCPRPKQFEHNLAFIHPNSAR